MKKLISMLLCLAMVLSLTVAVFAAEGQKEPEAGSNADVKTYVFADCDLPTEKGEIQDTKLDDVLSVGASHGFKDVKRGVLAIAKGQKMMITSTRGISKLVLNGTSNDSPISVEVSADGVNWTCTHEEIMLYTEYKDIEITFETPATHIRISTNALMRVKSMAVEYVAAELPVAPSEPETPTTDPVEPGTPIDPSGDNTFMVFALVVLSVTALVVLVSKKRVF